MAQQDDSAYQSNPYGTQDPTQLFQDMTQKNQQGGVGGGIAQGLAAAGGNSDLNKARFVQTRMAQILQTTGEAKDDEDPLDFQMRQARAISRGFANADPMTSMKADQQVIRLENAKAEQAKLSATTEYQKAETTKAKMQTAEAAADPMIVVRQKKDQYGLDTMERVGAPVSMFNEDGTSRTGWSNDIRGEMQKAGATPDLTFMKQSDYNKFMSNENRTLAQAIRAKQMQDLQMLSMQSPEAIKAQAERVENGLEQLPTPPAGRNPVLMLNYNRLADQISADGMDPGSIHREVYQNNLTHQRAFNEGTQADNIRRFGVMMTHAELARQYFDTLKAAEFDKGQIPLLNAITNRWQAMTGESGPITVASVNQFLAGEASSAIIGAKNGTALTDRIESQKKVNVNASSKQYNAVIDAWQNLASGQLEGYHREWASGLRKGNGDTWNKELLDKYWYGDENNVGHVSPEAKAWAQKSQGGHVPVQSDATKTANAAGEGTTGTIVQGGQTLDYVIRDGKKIVTKVH